MTSTSFDIVWDDNSTDETTFNMLYAVNGVTQPPYSLGANAGTGTLSTGFSGLSGWNTAVIQIQATNGSGSTVSNTVNLTFNIAFNAPNTPLTKVSANGSVLVMWTDNSSSENGYFVEIATAPGGPFTAWGSTPANSTALQGALDPSTTFYFRIRAFQGTAASPTATSAYTSVVSATTPVLAPPTSLTATTSSDGVVNLGWIDNCAVEDGFAVYIKLSTATSYTLYDYAAANATSFSVTDLAPNTAYNFQVTTAYQGATIIESLPSNTATATTMALAAPTALVRTVLNESSVKLEWTDNSQAEHGFLIQARYPPSGTFFDMAVAPPLTSTSGGITTNITGAHTYTLSLPNPLTYPGIDYEFKVVSAYDPGGGQPIITSNPTSTLAASVPFNAPTSFTATVAGENTVNFAWTDNSSVETQYFLLSRVSGTTQWQLLVSLAANTTSHSLTNITPGATYDFAVMANYRRATDDEVQSAASNVVTRTVPFNAPTNLVATPASDRQINFTWTDNSTVEDGYALYCKLPTESASQFRLCGFVGANVTSLSVSAMDTGFQTPFTPNTAYDFELAAFAGDTLSTPLAATATTKDGVTNDLSPPLFVNAAFSHTFAFTTGQGTISSTSITGTLPPGVTYNATTRTLTGPATARGSYTPTLNVSWSNGWATTYKVHLRPIYAKGRPIVATPIAAHTLTLGGAGASVVIPLAATFADPDSESAISMTVPGADGTPGGRSLTIILNDSVTPDTVNNFRYYLNASDGYVNSVFHRLSSGFVLQGGSYKSGASANAFTSIPKGGSFSTGVPNEPGLANIKGTLAMAKLGGNPNSATTDFFFNLNNNTANLDAQNEGFSVFGRVADPSIATMDALGVLPLPPASGNPQAPNYAVTVNGQSTFFTELPHNAVTAPASINSSQLLRINGVTQNVPVLGSHSASSSNTSIVTTSMTGTDLTITGVAPGTATISLQVTDLDGNQLLTPHTFTVTVSSTYSTWSAAEGLTAGQNGTADDPDADGRKNLLEYALMSGPLASNGSAEPVLGTSSDAGANKATLTFKVRKFAALTYTVEGSTDLLTWGTVWTSADGFADDNVTAAVDNADHTLLTVRDSAAYSSTQHRFLRLKVTSP